MNILFAILLFVAHYVGDFLLQSREIAENKSKRIGYLVMHGFFVFIPIGVVLAIVSTIGIGPAIFAAILYVLFHMVQDHFIWSYFEYKARLGGWQRGDENFNRWFFRILGLDQMLHMIVLFVISFGLFL